VSTAERTTLLAGVLRACAREEGGVRALARAVGLSPQTIHEVVAGCQPGRHVQRALAIYLGVTPEEIAAWAEERAPADPDVPSVNPPSESPGASFRNPAAPLPGAEP